MEPLVTTYLEMRTRIVAARDQRSEDRRQKFRVQELKEPDWKFNRDMYFGVGETWKWIDKRPWTDEQWKDYANDPNLRTFTGYCEDKVAGYFELRRNGAEGQRSAVRMKTTLKSRISGCCPSLSDAVLELRF